MAGVGEVNADLVRSSGFELHLDGSRAGIRFEDLVVRHRPLALRNQGGKALSMMGMTTERSVEGSDRLFRHALGDREVGFLDLSILERFYEARMGAGALGEEDDAGRASVEPMDHAGAQGVRFGQLTNVVQDACEERPSAVALTRVNNHIGRFVDGEQILVLVEDRKGHGLRG